MPAPCEVTSPPMKISGKVATAVQTASTCNARPGRRDDRVSGPWCSIRLYGGFFTSMLVNELLLPLDIARLRQPVFLDQRVAVLVRPVMDDRHLGEVAVGRRAAGVGPLERGRVPRIARSFLAPDP